jgi:hypothetical protein
MGASCRDHDSVGRGTGLAMTCVMRIFVHVLTGEIYEVAASESHLPTLRRRIVEDCGGDPEWKNETIFQHQVGFDVEKTVDIESPVVRKWSTFNSPPALKCS